MELNPGQRTCHHYDHGLCRIWTGLRRKYHTSTHPIQLYLMSRLDRYHCRSKGLLQPGP